MAKEDFLWIIGIIMILAGIALMIWGGYYLYAGAVVSSTEAALAEYGYQGAMGASLTAIGVVLLVIGIVLIIVGFLLVYKYKIKA